MEITKYVLLILYAVLNYLDWVTTKKAISKGAKELNPISMFLINRNLFAISKIVATLIVVATLLYASSTVIVIGLVVFYVWVVVNNYKIIKRL